MTSKRATAPKKNKPLTQRQASRIVDVLRNKSSGPSVNPAIEEARQRMRADVVRRVRVTKADVIEGFREAVDMARILQEPMTMIAGWREIGKVAGHYEPKRVEVHIDGPIAAQVGYLRTLSERELLELVGPDEAGVIDVDFTERRQAADETE